jgi:polar amino acid transport system substrate-binding protein
VVHFFFKSIISIFLAFIVYCDSRLAKADEFLITTPVSRATPYIAQSVREAYARIGHTIRIVDLPSKRSLAEINKGKYDGELVRIFGIEKNFPNLIMVDTPAYEVTINAIVRNSSTAQISSWRDLKPYQIAYPRGFIQIRNKTEGMQRVAVSINDQIGEMLIRGHIDIGVLSGIEARHTIGKHSELRIIEKPLHINILYHYLHKKNEHLRKPLSEAFKAMREEGRIEK